MAMGRIWQLQAWLILLCGTSSATFSGREFVAVFPQNDQEGSRAELQLLLSALGASCSATVATRLGTFSATLALPRGLPVPLPLPDSLELAGTHVADKAVLVRATCDVSVAAVNSKLYTAAAAALLPVARWGTRYYAVTPQGASREGFKELAVVAGNATTEVVVKVTGRFYHMRTSYPPGSTFHVVLKPYHSFQLQSIQDLSGSEVRSDKPVGVFSGHTCVKKFSGCDHAVEQLLPVASWGTTYVVPPAPQQKNVDLAYVVAAEEVTVTYSRGGAVATKAMVAGEVRKVEMRRDVALHVRASAPIQVVFFFTGNKKKGFWQDPLLLNVPPVSTYCTSYRVATLADYTNHLVLVARTAGAGATTLNQDAEKTLSWQEVPGTDFSWATVTVSQEEPIQSVENQQEPFGVLVFGFKSASGYGLAGLCATASASPSCEELGCKGRCEVVAGTPTCLQEPLLTCRLSGSGHYQTFDGRSLDFMGTCTYTLAKTCHPDPALPVFSVQAKNKPGGGLKVSSFGTLVVRVYDVTVAAAKAENGLVRVNDRLSHLPVSLARGKLRLQQKGRSLLIQTDFGLKILYDWADHLVLKVPGSFSGRVCGMCGDGDGDPGDDSRTPEGDPAEDDASWGRSWKVANESGSCWDGCRGCGGCRREAEFREETSCGLATRRPGPFEGCHNTLDPKVYLKNCVFDLCLNDGLQAALCQALQAYADDCREEGVAVAEWRTLANCPLSCPKNSNYTSCGTSCPTTCNDAALPADCATSPCVETCECHDGFVLDANECVPHDRCGCVSEGLLHGPHETFWGDETCTRSCSCDSGCHWSGCRAGEQCRVVDGIRGCYPESQGTCRVMGTTHYETFDGGRFIFQGTCLYQLAGLCQESQDLVGFQVLVQNGRHDAHLLASISLVTLRVYGKTITISQEHPGKVKINDRLVNLPYHPRDGKISIHRGGQEAVVETDFGLTLTYDWRSRATVTVPSTYSGSLCGLCGNFDGHAGDEVTPEGHPDALGLRWKVTDLPGCLELSKVECPLTAAVRRHQVASKRSCGIVLREDGPFGACHRRVDAVKYFQSCLHDSCLFPGREGVICSVIAAYASACQAADVAIGEWRTDDFCRLSCPPNSHYELCSQTCSQSCGSTSIPVSCSSRRCREGCACDSGFVLSGAECVPASRCGCRYQDFYYQLEETFFPSATERCQCQADETVACEAIPPPGDDGGGGDDDRSPAGAAGSCVATGDRSYVSFDGMAFNISGTCSYVLTETCDDASDEDLEGFVVKIKKESRRKKKVSRIQELSVQVHGLTLTFLRDKRGDVMVDSISHHLPVTLSSGRIQVLHHGMGILLQTDFGLLVSYDLIHHVRVTVPPRYRGHLCGLCGNYNGRGDDDFHLPSGHRALGAKDFGAFWMTPDGPCSEECPQDECPDCEKKKLVVFQKRIYCGIITLPKGPFASCHEVVDPAPYLQACLHDLCLAQGESRVLCQSVQSYATACQDSGVVIEPWRKPSFCPIACPAKSSYSLCTNHCSSSCAGSRGALRCPGGCREGCLCEEGLLFNGHSCVAQAQCGCFEDGVYYEPHQSFLKDNCQQRCTCVPGRGLTCDSHSCTGDETCEIQDGLLSCVNQNPCKALGCRPMETCDWRGSRPRCVPTLVGTCWLWGDPHYRTFDGLQFDFQGTCTYTLAESCGNDTGLVPFEVRGKNSIRGGVKSVSYVGLATVKVYGQQVSILQRERDKVRVNGVVTLLPVSLEEGKVEIFQSGLRAVLQTDFGLRVTYDWNWQLLLELPSSYSGHTCGLCGNFNLEAEDDVPRGAADPAALLAWAKSWKVGGDSDDDPFCWDHCEGDCPVCEEEKKELYGGNRYCGLIKKSFQGPFRACHEVVRPQEFYRACLYDVCMSDGAKSILCQALEAYGATCQQRGAVVQDWRTPAGCPLPCPENSHYEACGDPCPATCAQLHPPSSCNQPCVETCACNAGYVLSGGRCVPESSCGCTHDGLYYRPGAEFWADGSCRRRCRCQEELGMVVCEEGGCKAGERCGVVDGVRRCVAKEKVVCVASGDPHYTTFDGRRYDFMGSCVYLLAGLCSADPTLVPFKVTVENNHRGSRVVSFTKEVTLNVYNMSLGFSQEHPQKLKVNGLLVDLPFHHAEQLQVYQSGLHGFIKTDFDLVVTFDWHSYARVFLPTTYSGAVCGLCGDADGDPDDDLLLADGDQASHPSQLGARWRVAEVPGCSPGCSEDCEVCGEAEKRHYRGEKHCGLLLKKGGPFSSCHPVLDPAPYAADCVFDACVYEGHQDSVCGNVAAYAAACQARGVALGSWRTEDFCGLVCPPNQHYELCGPSCHPTCSGQREPETCREVTPCSEGCFCDPGFLRSGDRCVPLASCGCTHGGLYYGDGEEFFPDPGCQQRCRCREGEAECWAEGCGEGEECGVKEGVRGCYPTSCGRCQLLGAGGYVTFDGRRLWLGGSCSYLLAEVVAGGPGDAAVAFRVAVEKEEGEEGTVVRRLSVAARGVTVGLERGGQWEVTVDGERHLLPLSLAEGSLTVSQEGIHRVLVVQGGPKLLYDGDSYVLLTLPSTYRRRPRGLCGDFNGDPDDDPAAPEELGVALTPNCTHSTTPPTCPAAEPGPCGVLTDSSGPFSGCHGVVDPQDYVAGCLQDQCGHPGDGSLCRSLQGYAAACQAAGGQLREWRGVTNCPLECPPDSGYEVCGRGCDVSCAGLTSPPPCTPRCFEGCRCHRGLFFDGADCVPPEQCGCLHRGRYFQLAESIVSRDCSQTCTCQAAGGFQCQPTSCPWGQSCGLLADGSRGCLERPGRCSLGPGTRLVTFDGATGPELPAGIYVASAVRNRSRSDWFRLLLDVGRKGQREAELGIHLFTSGPLLTVKTGGKLWVNGLPTPVPAAIPGSVTVTASGGSVRVSLGAEVSVELEPTGLVTVTVPPRGLSRGLRGLCGDYDGAADNDLRGPDGDRPEQAEVLAQAWRAPDFNHFQ